MKYDLEERTTKFSKKIIGFCRQIKIQILNENIVRQLLRSATSVGANYREANGASSKKDFRNKIHISKKEIRETKYWLELLSEIETDKKKIIEIIWEEVHELSLIFNKISSSLKHSKIS